MTKDTRKACALYNTIACLILVCVILVPMHTSAYYANNRGDVVATDILYKKILSLFGTTKTKRAWSIVFRDGQGAALQANTLATQQSTSITIGSKVTTTSRVNVRSGPGIREDSLGVHTPNTKGVVVDGPVSTGAYTWWKVDYEVSPDGWTVSNYLEKITEPEFIPDIVRVGDEQVSYTNIEFTEDGKYAVWFEQSTDGTGRGNVWHCGVDRNNGSFYPPDCKGFLAFESTVLARANPGIDSNGSYYIGSDRSGKLMYVRPTSATTGEVRALTTPKDKTRRAFYPSSLPDTDERYVLWIKNSDVPGTGTNLLNTWYELQYINIDEPEKVVVIERQTRDEGSKGLVPMDSGFVRWFRNAPLISFGSSDGARVQVKVFDVHTPTNGARFATNDEYDHIDPFTWRDGFSEYMLSGNSSSENMTFYKRTVGEPLFKAIRTVTLPSSSHLANPSLAQSGEWVEWQGHSYGAYQVTESGGGSFYENTFSMPGEIWLTTLYPSDATTSWPLAYKNDNLAYSEPEPYAPWVFFSAIPVGGNPVTSVWQLFKANTPLQSKEGGRIIR